MKPREFINLPLGNYRLTDGIWDYSLKKCLVPDCKRVFYLIKEISRGNTFTLHEYIEEEDGLSYKKISACVRIGGIFIHSKDLCFSLERLRFIPKSSFKETFAKLEILSEI